MARFEDGSYGTAAGIALIGKVLAGRCKMNYTRVAAGKGIIPEDMTPKNMTAPADYVMDAKISGITNPVDGECQITVQINSADVERGFYCTCLVLYAEDPDEGEVAYTYLALENEPEWIRPASSIVGKFATFDIISAVGDIDAVSAAIDPDAFATIGEMQRMVETEVAEALDERMRNVGQTIIREVTIPAEGWTAVEGESPPGGYGYTLTMTLPEALTAHFPHLALDLPSHVTAGEAGLCPTMETLDGSVRFWAQRVPTAAMSGTLKLTSATPTGTVPPSGYEVATDEEVKESIEDILSGNADNPGDSDGSEDVSGEIATDEEVAEKIKEVFS